MFEDPFEAGEERFEWVEADLDLVTGGIFSWFSYFDPVTDEGELGVDDDVEGKGSGWVVRFESGVFRPELRMRKGLSG